MVRAGKRRHPGVVAPVLTQWLGEGTGTGRAAGGTMGIQIVLTTDTGCREISMVGHRITASECRGATRD